MSCNVYDRFYDWQVHVDPAKKRMFGIIVALLFVLVLHLPGLVSKFDAYWLVFGLLGIYFFIIFVTKK